MLRIIEETPGNYHVYKGTPSEDRFRLSLVDLGHGQREASVNRETDWVHDAPLDPDSRAAQILRGEIDDPEADEKKQRNLERAARRAKVNVRRRCKAQGLDKLFTLTYRGNQTDQALCELHLKLFLERIRRVIPNFVYVACFEQQKRGAWHIHLAARRLPMTLKASNGVAVKSWNIVRSIWRSVTGVWGGNFDQARKKYYAKMSPAKCAAYISKYVLKMFAEGVEHSKRFRASKCDVPKPTMMEFQRASLADVMELAVSWVCEGGQALATSWLSQFKDVYFVVSEPPGRATNLPD